MFSLLISLEVLVLSTNFSTLALPFSVGFLTFSTFFNNVGCEICSLYRDTQVEPKFFIDFKVSCSILLQLLCL